MHSNLGIGMPKGSHEIMPIAREWGVSIRIQAPGHDFQFQQEHERNIELLQIQSYYVNETSSQLSGLCTSLDDNGTHLHITCHSDLLKGFQLLLPSRSGNLAIRKMKSCPPSNVGTPI